MTSCARAVRRSAVAIGSLVSLVLTLLLSTATPASAHATLLFTSPAADATVADSPKSLVLVFDQPISLNGSSVRVEPLTHLGAATLGQGNQTVTIPVPTTLPEGVHTVHWQVTARDGDVMTGSYRFAVGPRTLALASGQTTAAKDATPTTILRWLLFAALAIALAVLGVYGVVGYAVARRTREAGIRLAVGAQPNTIVRLLMREGVTLVIVGTIVGMALGLGSAQLLRTLLYGVGASDPVTFLGAPALLLVVGVVAAFLPARRAGRVDPARVLRAE